ncbi:hypothetical protein JOQ06_000022, partial [Pogonophryne albipinna]
TSLAEFRCSHMSVYPAGLHIHAAPGKHCWICGGRAEEDPESPEFRLPRKLRESMKQEELADRLQSRTFAAVCQRKLKSTLKERFHH